MFLVFVLLAASLVWTILVVDVVAETAAAGGLAIELFGATLAITRPSTAIVVVAILAASAGVLLVSTLAVVRGRWLERTFADDYDARYEALSTSAAGWEARNGLIHWQIDDLREQQRQLLAKRDELLREMNAARQHTTELRRVARRQKEALDELSRAAEEVVIVPSTEPFEDEPIEVPDAGSSIPAAPQPSPHHELTARLADLRRD